MSKYIPGNQKHLTLDDRKYIEKSLNEGVSFKDIARFLCKDPTTISKEIRLPRLDDWFHKGPFYNEQLRNNRSITMNTLEKLCVLLECGPDGIVSFPQAKD